ncbi:hypothetical protein Rsub_07391 [Raphidocelis subcapitata]|uniref:DUF6815 domain-containing protein n=1 Tax=Raphidocelis subcapitata TaxID=307507 RepID=A0A2V0PC23_9CHLO|nr:hypothetical protein Rsub_07391 [Raphidocelis subcapitata]|eukprot:GBF94655.1 hypothetical protein Rsub_07391 [Raphidocelis subcapitata]
MEPCHRGTKLAQRPGKPSARADQGPSPALRAASAEARRRVVVFEVAGGGDKGPDGHRRDTLPIVRALKARGWDAEVLFYTDADRAALTAHAAASADAFLFRVNPGAYEGYSEEAFLQMGRDLHAAGCHALQHPDVMLSYGAKDSLVKLRSTATGLGDTEVYYDAGSFLAGFPKTLAQSDRVLKQNRGSAGEGIFVVKPHGWRRTRRLAAVPGDALVEATEMSDNSTRVHRLADFMAACEQYTQGANGLLVDQRFLPRIVEGEVRVLMIYDRPVSVVHKRPAEGAMSATLFSGASYTYDDASDPKWRRLLARWTAGLPQVRALLGGLDYPLIWTADFILDTNPDGSDAYRLGELNASCVGFTTHLELAEVVADAIISVVTAARRDAGADIAAPPATPPPRAAVAERGVAAYAPQAAYVVA